MTTRKLRKIVWTALMALGLSAAAIPAIASHLNGGITLTSPAPNLATGGEIRFEWTWRSGSYVRSTSNISLSLTTNGVTWTRFANALPIRDGEYTLDAALLPDDTYAFRAQVSTSKAFIADVVSPIHVDHTAPTVEITRPAEGDIIVDDQKVASMAIIIGTATLEAEASDATSGIASIEWRLDGRTIGQGASYTHNFSAEEPGEHTLAAVATDGAGNSASHEITVWTAPSASALPPVPGIGDLPVPQDDPEPEPDPSGDPQPSPSPSEEAGSQEPPAEHPDDPPADDPSLNPGVSIPGL